MTYQQARDYLLAKAREQQLEVEILATESRNLTLESFQNKLSQITQATQGGIGLRLVTAGKTGYASTEDLSPAALEWVLSEARENAELQSETGGFLPAGRSVGHQDLLSEGLSAATEEKADKVLTLEQELRQHPKVKQIPLTRYTEQESLLSLSSTTGIDGGYRNGYSYLASIVIMQDGNSVKQNFDLQLEKEFHLLEPGRTALKLLENTERLLNAKALKTGRYTAYFEPKTFSQLLALIVYMLNGKNVIEGKSRLADKLGQQVAASNVTIIDDPNLPGGLNNRPFDSEGTPGQRLELIKQGVLTSFMHNSMTAAILDQSNTGHASRSYKSTLGVSPSNIFLEPGQGVNPAEGIIVTELMGVHAGANPISGDFSLQALGLQVKGGEVTQAVENFAISSNLLTLLQTITAVGDKLEWNPMAGMIGSPMVEVAEMSFAGA